MRWRKRRNRDKQAGISVGYSEKRWRAFKLHATPTGTMAQLAQPARPNASAPRELFWVAWDLPGRVLA